MTIRYIDAHCHLQFEQYAEDREELIERMRAEGVAAIVVGVDRESSEQALALAEKHGHLYAAVGLHPSHAAGELFDAEAFRALATHPKAVAIGECGLEYFRLGIGDEKQAQKELFKKHIALAAELDKPLIIHARPSSAKATEGKLINDAYQDLIAILKEAKATHPNVRGDIHFFAGTLEEAEAFFALGFNISFTAVITFACDYDAVIRAAPLANVLAETDAPYVAPASRRGARNDPLAVIDVVNKIAALCGEDPETVRAAFLTNTKQLFALQTA